MRKIIIGIFTLSVLFNLACVAFFNQTIQCYNGSLYSNGGGIFENRDKIGTIYKMKHRTVCGLLGVNEFSATFFTAKEKPITKGW